MSASTVPLSKSQSHTAVELRLVIGRLIRAIRQHNAGGLTPSQVSALATIEELGPIRISDLAAHESIGAPVATRVTTSLEELGYIKRLQDTQDRRAWLVELTAAGHKVLRNLREERTAGINQRIQMLSKSEIATLNAALPVLDKLAKNI
ncbi:MAG TPA: MarR family transcriptional regulator [Candidatus Nanopelagicaceae bacterium]